MTDAEYFTSNRYTFWRAAMDHAEDSDGAEYAFRGDAQYSFNDDSFLRRFKVGGRYADRDQTVRYTSIIGAASPKSGRRTAGSAVFFDEYPEGQYATEFFEFPNFFRGATPGPIGGNYFACDLIGQYENSAAFFQGIEDYFRNGQVGCTNSCSEVGGNGVPLSEPQGWRPLAPA